MKTMAIASPDVGIERASPTSGTNVLKHGYKYRQIVISMIALPISQPNNAKKWISS
jgi:hypothetical protein